MHFQASISSGGTIPELGYMFSRKSITPTSASVSVFPAMASPISIPPAVSPILTMTSSVPRQGHTNPAQLSIGYTRVKLFYHTVRRRSTVSNAAVVGVSDFHRSPLSRVLSSSRSDRGHAQRTEVGLTPRKTPSRLLSASRCIVLCSWACPAARSLVGGPSRRTQLASGANFAAPLQSAMYPQGECL